MADEAAVNARIAAALATERAATAVALASERAATAVALATAAAREEELTAELARLRLVHDGVAAAAAGAAGGEAAAVDSQLSMPLHALPSPSTGTTNIIDGVFCAIVERPVAAASLGLSAPAPSVARAFRALLDAADGDPRALAPEANFYARALQPLPSFAERVGGPAGNVEAAALFTRRSLVTRAWSLAGGCRPELHVRAAVSAEHPFRPGFNGEVKSVGATWLEQAVYYTAMDMVRVFFPADEAGAAPGPRCFFAKPPAGFALVAFPHVGYFVALEWIGVLFVSPVSAPFVIGSDEHSAAAAALPDVAYAPPEPLVTGLPWRTWPPQRPATAAAMAAAAPRPPHESVSWSIAGGRFRKLVRADARSPARFRALHDAYARLSELTAAAAAPGAPAALGAVAAGVRLLYGAHEVMVEMAALGGARDASDAEVMGAGPLLDAAAAAVVWLARRGLLYTDLRGPNVVVAGEEAWLVDFDDCIVLAEPVRDVGAFRAALVATGASAMGAWASALVRDALPRVAAALEAAFAAAAQSELRAAPVRQHVHSCAVTNVADLVGLVKAGPRAASGGGGET